MKLGEITATVKYLIELVEKEIVPALAEMRDRIKASEHTSAKGITEAIEGVNQELLSKTDLVRTSYMEMVDRLAASMDEKRAADFTELQNRLAGSQEAVKTDLEDFRKEIKAELEHIGTARAQDKTEFRAAVEADLKALESTLSTALGSAKDAILLAGREELEKGLQGVLDTYSTGMAELTNKVSTLRGEFTDSKAEYESVFKELQKAVEDQDVKRIEAATAMMADMTRELNERLLSHTEKAVQLEARQQQADGALEAHGERLSSLGMALDGLKLKVGDLDKLLNEQPETVHPDDLAKIISDLRVQVSNVVDNHKTEAEKSINDLSSLCVKTSESVASEVAKLAERMSQDLREQANAEAEARVTMVGKISEHASKEIDAVREDVVCRINTVAKRADVLEQSVTDVNEAVVKLGTENKTGIEAIHAKIAEQDVEIGVLRSALHSAEENRKLAVAREAEERRALEDRLGALAKQREEHHEAQQAALSELEVRIKGMFDDVRGAVASIQGEFKTRDEKMVEFSASINTSLGEITAKFEEVNERFGTQTELIGRNKAHVGEVELRLNDLSKQVEELPGPFDPAPIMDHIETLRSHIVENQVKMVSGINEEFERFNKSANDAMTLMQTSLSDHTHDIEPAIKAAVEPLRTTLEELTQDIAKRDVKIRADFDDALKDVTNTGDLLWKALAEADAQVKNHAHDVQTPINEAVAPLREALELARADIAEREVKLRAAMDEMHKDVNVTHAALQKALAEHTHQPEIEAALKPLGDTLQEVMTGVAEREVELRATLDNMQREMQYGDEQVKKALGEHTVEAMKPLNDALQEVMADMAAREVKLRAVMDTAHRELTEADKAIEALVEGHSHPPPELPDIDKMIAAVRDDMAREIAEGSTIMLQTVVRTEEEIDRRVTARLEEAITKVRTEITEPLEVLEAEKVDLAPINEALVTLGEKVAELATRESNVNVKVEASDLTWEIQGEKLIAKHGENVVGTFDVLRPGFRGVYNIDEKYVPGDLVSYEGSLWMSLKQNPGRPSQAFLDWRLVVKKGKDGVDGKAGASVRTFEGHKTGVTYRRGDFLRLHGRLWQCSIATKQPPEGAQITSSEEWALIGFVQ